ncbi:rhodanese-like domain-containing protein [Mariprofundus sp. EBB-1]|uniref:rhodanese-like domain-containing protein n=1 Tax=Mariprofundus sp. EBB-1 TaxID=2650971 RepID=UPI000EF1D410|nr:rhodanese-like domain-containing protein [Mariprofundus sp. EBB-1]RLL54729.1 rhodanese-like domain-containing protein [Mariprofundus sp. EBB-1]
MEFIEQNMVYVVSALLIVWILWKRVLAPKLAGVKSLSAADYMQFRHQEHIILDVRQPAEWSSGHAKDAMHMPLSEVGAHMHEISRDKPVVVICASGNRSAMAATALAKAGFDMVYNFSGGMGAWQGAGLPTQSGA